MTDWLDKSGWIKITFGNVCQNLNITEKNPLQKGIDRFIGLEHIEPENLHINSWGNVNNGTTFTKRFKKGDVLFGKRRAYQRKVAVAEFDGICSGDILVLEPIQELLDPKLLPFLCLSDKFFEYAVKTSAGSLSPRTKFQDLALFEFLLPPKHQQVKLAELLWAGDDIFQKEQRFYSSYLAFYERYLNDLVDGKMDGTLTDNWRTYKLGDLGNSYGGLSGKNKSDFGAGSPFITYMNIFLNSKIDPNRVNYVRINEGEKQNKIQFGDIFFTGSSETPEEVGMSSVLLDEIPNCYLNSFCFGFRLHDFDTIIPEYARFYFRSKEIRSFMTLHAQGYTRHNISKNTILQKLKVRLPNINRQKEIAQMLENAIQQKLKIDDKLNKNREIVQRINNLIFN